jgi:hypothetical protein
MDVSRRKFLGGAALVTLAAPAVITRPGLLMRVRSLFLPPTTITLATQVYVDYQFSSQELALTLEEYAKRYCTPLVEHLAEQQRRAMFEGTVFSRSWVDDSGVQTALLDASEVYVDVGKLRVRNALPIGDLTR